jgi:aspartyl-tRNA(Asn)/glutamyl-tRNA(Gln) amidotransferase subunit B
VGELPIARERRFVDSYGLTSADAALLTLERPVADTFEEVVAGHSDTTFARSAANWIVNDIMGIARAQGLRLDELPFSAAQIRDLVEAVEGKTLTGRAAKEVLGQLQADELPSKAAERLNLVSIDDDEAVRAAAQEAIDANPSVAADFRGGKQAAIGRLIGETMKRTGGRAKPDAVRAALLALLQG